MHHWTRPWFTQGNRKLLKGQIVFGIFEFEITTLQVIPTKWFEIHISQIVKPIVSTTLNMQWPTKPYKGYIIKFSLNYHSSFVGPSILKFRKSEP